MFRSKKIPLSIKKIIFSNIEDINDLDEGDQIKLTGIFKKEKYLFKNRYSVKVITLMDEKGNYIDCHLSNKQVNLI